MLISIKKTHIHFFCLKSFWYFWCPFQFKVFHFSWYRYCFRLLDGNILTKHLVKSLETFCLYTKVERLLVFILTCTFTCKLTNSKDSLISDPLHCHLHSCHENSKHTSTPILLDNWLIVDDDNNSDYVHSPIDLSYQCWFINLKLQLKDFSFNWSKSKISHKRFTLSFHCYRDCHWVFTRSINDRWKLYIENISFRFHSKHLIRLQSDLKVMTPIAENPLWSSLQSILYYFFLFVYLFAHFIICVVLRIGDLELWFHNNMELMCRKL